VVELSNGTLTSIQGHQAKNPALTIMVNRADLELVMMGQTTIDDLAAGGTAKLDGNRAPYDPLKASVVQFNMGFEILSGTKVTTPGTQRMESFEQEPPSPTDGG
jgi:alkyl sulfatase BDS1-like metallo-beta-lactamase superfamily hydrolase